MDKSVIILPVVSGDKMEELTKRLCEQPIPALTKLLNHRELDFQIFSFLQMKSQWNKEQQTRYVSRLNYTQEQMYKDFIEVKWDKTFKQVSKSTFLSRFRKLEKIYGLIEKSKVRLNGGWVPVYIIHNDCFYMYESFPYDTMETLSTTSSNTIKVYTELYKRWECREKYPEGLKFSFAELLRELGYNDEPANNSIIKGALDVLCGLGLIECSNYIGASRLYQEKMVEGRVVKVPYILLKGAKKNIQRHWLKS